MATGTSVQTPDGAFDASLSTVLNMDREALLKARKSYGESWCKRGGVGAYMMLARKWDRLENFLSTNRPGNEKYDILMAAENDQRPEGVIDDIRDLRRYLALIEAKLIERNVCPGHLKKDAGPYQKSGALDKAKHETAFTEPMPRAQLGLGYYRSLLAAYMDHIASVIGHTFLEHPSNAYLSKQDKKDLLDIYTQCADFQDDTPDASTLHPK